MEAVNRKTNEEFVEELKRKGIDYTPMGDYNGAKTKISFRCNKCGHVWGASPTNILSGRGCPNCKKIKARDRLIYTESKFKLLLQNVNPDITVLSAYNGSKEKIMVRCEKHETEWSTSPNALLRGCGCKECIKEKITLKNGRTHDDFIEIVKRNYPHIEILSKYGNAKSIIKCRCKIHNYNFTKMADALSSSKGQCPICTMSEGEKVVAAFLRRNNIDFIPEYRFKDEPEIQKKRFDFFIPGLNMCIEYDGAQHFIPMKDMGGTPYFEYMRENDAIKNEYCIRNGIRLVRISYKENIDERLQKELFN